MRHSILRFFLIFACVAIPLHSHACWDDSSDDYYDYDDYDDDWYDDWYFDDDDWNYDDDDIVYGEISEDNYDMNGGELDEVVVTPDEDYDWDLMMTGGEPTMAMMMTIVMMMNGRMITVMIPQKATTIMRLEETTMVTKNRIL